MNILYIILGVLLAALFFINIKDAADVLCRIIGGFVILFTCNLIAGYFSLPEIGVNLVSAGLTGIIGLPGWLLVLCVSFIL